MIRSGGSELTRMPLAQDTDRSIPWIARRLLDTGPAGVALLEGEDFQYAYVNAAYQALAPERPMVGRPFAQVWPELAGAVVPILRSVRETGQGFEASEMRFELRRGDGVAPSWFSFRFEAIAGPAGEPAAIGAHVVDRTGAVLAREREAELARERTKVLEVEQTARAAELLAETIPQMVWTAGADGSADWFNRRWLDYTGQALAEARGLGWQGVVHPDDAPRAAARWAVSVRSGEPYEIEFRLRRADGAARWHLGRGAPVRASDSRVLRWFATATDIDDQKRAQETIQSARGRAEEAAWAAARRAAELDIVLDAIADGLVLTDARGRIVRANAAAQRMLGYAEEDQSLDALERLSRYRAFRPDGQAVPVAALPPIRALRGEVVRNEEIRFERRGGGSRWVSISSAPVRHVDDRIEGVVTTFSDVTAAHEMQEQREDLLRAISHDLRTPLTVIMAQAQMLARRPEDPALVLRRAESIRTSSARMATMIADLVELVRLEAGNVKLEPRPVPIAPFAAELRDRLRGAIAVERLRLEVPEPLPAALADPPLLERILVNLITNALKYSPPGSEAVLSAAARDGRVRITVQDRGDGISPEELPRIFERFYRSPSAAQKEGLGLGLYITRLLVEAHGGSISVDSAPGVGSAFHVLLPAV